MFKLPLPINFPLTPSPNVIKSRLHSWILVSSSLLSVMCLNEPLSKYRFWLTLAQSDRQVTKHVFSCLKTQFCLIFFVFFMFLLVNQVLGTIPLDVPSHL